ncbi:MAG: putative toxin [Bacillota bacterium]
MYNAHGDVTALTDASGNVLGTYQYDAFGNIREKTYEKSNPYTYAGYRYDEEMDLYYLNARYYDPKIARFITEDTYKGQLNDPLSLNLYTYCSNNPIVYYDPTGHGQVWNRFGEVIGSTDGDDYTDYSDEATDTHGGSHMADKEWKRDRRDRDRSGSSISSYDVDNWGDGLRSIFGNAVNVPVSDIARMTRFLYGKSTNDFDDASKPVYYAATINSNYRMTILYQETGTTISGEAYEGLLQYIIDYGKELAGNRQYVYDPKNWQDELQNNIKPLIDMIPSDLSDEQRIPIVDSIIIAEAQKLQAKYSTAYTASDNVISKYITERGLHQGLVPLYEQYPVVEKNTNPLVKAFFEGFTDGFQAGVWYSVASSTSKVESATEYARRVGRAGEQAAGIIKNTTRIKSITGSAKYRIPDGLDDANKLIQEVKNVKYQGLTNQIKDFSAYAKREGYTFELFVRPDTKISSPLQKLIDTGEIIIKHINP